MPVCTSTLTRCFCSVWLPATWCDGLFPVRETHHHTSWKNCNDQQWQKSNHHRPWCTVTLCRCSLQSLCCHQCTSCHCHTWWRRQPRLHPLFSRLLLWSLERIVMNELHKSTFQCIDHALSTANLCETVCKLSFRTHPPEIGSNLLQHVTINQNFDCNSFVQWRLYVFPPDGVVQRLAVCDHCTWHIQTCLSLLHAHSRVHQHLEEQLHHKDFF